MKMFHKGIVKKTIVNTDNNNIDLWTQSCLMSRSDTDKTFCPHNGFFQVTNADPNKKPIDTTKPVNVNNRNEDALNSWNF
jgi:hypothetical protein